MKAEEDLESMGPSELDALYRDAMHAMQTLVSLDHAQGSSDGTPKHLRVGVNSALVAHAALVGLLIKKGVINFHEYQVEVLLETRAEVARYRERMGLPDNIKVL